MTEWLLKNLNELESEIYEFEIEISKFAIFPKNIQEFEALYEKHQKFLNACMAVCSSVQSDKEREYVTNHKGIKALQNLNYLMEILYQRYVGCFEKDSIKSDALDEAMFQDAWEDFVQIVSFKRLEREIFKGNKGSANYANLIKEYEFLEQRVIGQKNGNSVDKKGIAMGRMEIRKTEAEAKLGQTENQLDIFLKSLDKKTISYGSKDKFASVENHKKDIVLDFDFFDRLTLVSQIKYLDCLMKNTEVLGMNASGDEVVEIEYQGKIKQIPAYYEAAYRKYMAMKKNLFVKFMKSVDETAQESQEEKQFKEAEYSDFKNVQGATARADEKIEEDNFQSEESMEDIYEKIEQLQNQKVKDSKTKQMLKIYKNKLKRMYKNKKSKKAQDLDAFWNHFPGLAGMEKISETVLHYWHFLTYEPEEFMQSKEFSDDTKAQAISSFLSLFDTYEGPEDDLLNEQKEHLENNQALVTPSQDQKVLKVKKKKKSEKKKKIRCEVDRHCDQVVISSADIQDLSIIIGDGQTISIIDDQVEIKGRT